MPIVSADDTARVLVARPLRDVVQMAPPAETPIRASAPTWTRTIRRGGELVKVVEPAKGGQPFQNGRSTGADSVPSSRKALAETSGISPRQMKTMLRVASVPEDDFEAAVESDDPPTVTNFSSIQRTSPKLRGCQRTNRRAPSQR
jgi:hypothetical protein